MVGLSKRAARGTLPVVLTPRTCCKCGKGFGSFAREIICRECKKPKQKEQARALAGEALSQRELQVAAKVAEAKSSKVIAYELRLTHGTVKQYLTLIFKKLDISNRTALARWHWQRSNPQ